MTIDESPLRPITLLPIGWVVSERSEVRDDDWDTVAAHVELDARFGPEALQGLDGFSHVEVLFLLDRVAPERVVTSARHPRNNPGWPQVGIFAQRGKNRPNRLGLTVCRVLAIDGRRLRVEGLDAVHGTPVLDLKPWVAEFGPRGPVHQPRWMTELMADYW